MNERWRQGGLVAFLAVGWLAVAQGAWRSGEELHTLLETAATLLALFVGALAMVRFYTKKTNRFLFVGTAFVGTGLLDGYHALVTSSFLAERLPSGLPSLIPWSWLASRFFLSLMLWLSWLGWRREARLGEEGRLAERAIYLAAGGLSLVSFIVFAFVPLPRAYYPELIVQRPEELLPAFLFLLTLVGAYRERAWRHGVFNRWLVRSLEIAVAGQLFFMPFSKELFDGWFDAAHLLKIVSYALVLVGLTVEMSDLFKRAEASAEEIRASHRSLKRAEARLRQLIEENLDGMVIFDAGGVVKFVNPAAEKLAGATTEELLTSAVRQPLLGGATRELEICGAHGGRTVVEVRVVETRWEGAEVYLASLRDITDRRRLEEQLTEIRKMEAIGQLAGGIAHDFNNLLTVILARTEQLLRALPAEDPLRALPQEAIRAARRAASLTRQLLALGSRQVLSPRVLSLSSVVGGVRQMLQAIVGEGVELVTRLEGSEGCLEADPGQLELVMVNLAANARDAMPEGGTLLIEIADVELEEAYTATHEPMAPGAYVRLAVSDTGVGMDPATQARVFEPFFTTKGPGRGTGLGLATVYGIVKQSQGYVWVYSERGRGTTFKCYFPRVDGAAEEIEEPATGQALDLSRGSETVLLVEDQAEVRAATRSALEDLGYSVLDAPGGEEALERLEKHGRRIDLVVTDMVMQGMNGAQLAARLTRLYPGLPVLFVSGYTGDAIARHDGLGSDAEYLEKPFTHRELARRVRRMLDTRDR